MIIKFKRGSKFLLAIALLVLASSSCTKENIEECLGNLRLSFTFTLHLNGGEKFGDDVNVVRVYLFDQQGVLAHIQQGQGRDLTDDYVMDVKVAPGKYTVIAWGGSYEDFDNSFHEAHMNDPITHDYQMGVNIGRTTLEDFRTIINYGIADDYPEDVMPTIDEFDDLYYGAVGERQGGTSQYLYEQVEVIPSTTVERKIEMICDTNILRVTISGLQYLQHYTPTKSADVLNVWASARNGRYRWDNSIGEYARMLRYPPLYRSLDANTMVVDLKVLRLDMVRHQAQPMYLTIQNPVTGATYPSRPIDVVNLLLKARDPNTGEYIYQSQEDFDKIYVHPIDIVIGADLRIRIFIHGWEIINVRPI